HSRSFERTCPDRPRSRQCSPGQWKVPARESSLWLCFPNYSRFFAFQLEGKPLGLLRNEVRRTVSPFDQRDAIAENVIVESEAQDGLAVVEPVKIEVVNGQTAVLVLVDEDEGGARNFRAASQACHEA